MANYLNIDMDQTVLIQVSLEQLQELAPLAWKVLLILNHLNLEAFDKDYHNDNVGAKAYPPKNMLAILIYSYMNAITSTRRIEELCKTSFIYLLLSGFKPPDHTSIFNFRTKHEKALQEIFTQTVYMGIDAELIDFSHIATDGTKLDGMGSKNQFITGDKIDSKIEAITNYVTKLMEKADLSDDNTLCETKKLSVEKKKHTVEKVVSRLQTAKASYDAVKNDLKDDKVFRIHLTEPDAKLLKDKDGYHSGYNCQASIDSKCQMIIDQRVTQSEKDAAEGQITRERLISKYGLERLCGSTLSFDNGYHNQELIKLDGQDGISLLVSQGKEGKQISNSVENDGFRYNMEKDVFICPIGKELRNVREKILSGKTLIEYQINGCANCESNDKCFNKNAKNKRQKTKLIEKSKLGTREIYETYQDKMRQPEVVEEYKKRKIVGELPFAHIQHHRGFKRFNVWGKVKAGMEFTLVTIVHNICKLISYDYLNLATT